MNTNQCDGCSRGLPKNEDGNHLDPDSWMGISGCTAEAVVRKVKDIGWTIPDEIKNYIQFQAQNEPVCEWAEGLAKKYHSIAVFEAVFGSCNMWGDRLGNVGTRLWQQYVSCWGIADVNPATLRQFCELQVAARIPNHKKEWTAKLDEVMP